MGKVALNKDEMLRFYPVETKEITRQILATKTGSKAGESKIEFYFHYAQVIKGHDFDRADLSTIFNISLCGSIDGKVEKKIPLKEMPELFKTKYVKMMQDEADARLVEHERFMKLSPEERALETRETLDKLGKINRKMGEKMTYASSRVIKFQKYDVDNLLDKISASGISSLTDDELKFLNNHSKSL